MVDLQNGNVVKAVTVGHEQWPGSGQAIKGFALPVVLGISAVAVAAGFTS